MSTEKILKSNNTIMDKKVSAVRVDINDLLARVRKQKQKNDFSNLVFLSISVAVIVIFGMILSF
tara:strand:+ start:400 stop:591 length:192 start_codon:yes stop_codon:yes gene_type:complete